MNRISPLLLFSLPLFISCGDGKGDQLTDEQVEVMLAAPMLPATFAALALFSFPYFFGD